MIELRKMDEADYTAYETLVTDERVMRYITEHPLTKAEAKRRFASIMEQQRHDRLGSYLVYQDETWIGIGHITRDTRLYAIAGTVGSRICVLTRFPTA
ncbi:RimJ/RimL family protein N-acetyltransferase [Exiguobacterium sp. PvP048]|uniref:GNAT family N-acetyltransferase n=1 Tax=unclassified Exiguobacterium TaxID=2644629 RepID=UPI0033996D03